MEKHDDVCGSLSPSHVPQRLRSAIDRIGDADRCLDLTDAAWRPVAAEHWDQARQLLAKVKLELEAALAPWAR